MHVTGVLAEKANKGMLESDFPSCVSHNCLWFSLFFGDDIGIAFWGNPISGGASQLAQQRLNALGNCIFGVRKMLI